MKKVLILTALAVLTAVLLVSCAVDETTATSTTSTTAGKPSVDTPAGTLTVEEALMLAKTIFGTPDTTADTYTVTGYVTAIGEDSITLTEDGHSIICPFGGKSYDGLHLGDRVALNGHIQNRGGVGAIVDFTADTVTPATYIITTLLSDNGLVTASKLQNIAWGESVTVTATANSGFKVSAIVVNGKTVSTAATATVTVSENLSIEAIFVSDDSAGSGSGNDGTGSGGSDDTGSDGVAGEEKTVTYTFAEYASGVQYGNETHKLDDTLTVETADCHFTEQLRLYQDSTHDGTAVFVSTKPITALKVNAGHKNATLDVYGSKDGVTYEKLGSVDVSTSYGEKTLDFEDKYTYIKLDAVGAQVRIQTVTVTTVG